MSEHELDVVLFGATGFVGRLVAERLAAIDLGGLRVGLGGRSRDRLTQLQRGLGVDWPVLTAESQDGPSLRRLAESARVVVSTVGPYARHGLQLVGACAAAGTSYADLTGEPTFVRRSIDAHHETAASTGARIVHSCGFDSVPSDLGVQLLADRVIADGAGELAEATLLVVSIRGGVSGGTIDSMRGIIDEIRDDAELGRRLADPYLFSPDRDREPDLGRQPDAFFVQRLEDGSWVAPFVMSSYNSRVVRRSNALQDHRYGRELRYREVVRTGSSPLGAAAAAGVALGSGALAAGLSNRLTRPLLDRVLPAPGEGPSEKARNNGHFTLEIRAVTTTGALYTATVAAQGDPGYLATAVMLSESARCLAQDDLPATGGVLTPATAMNGALVRRLRDSGFTFEVRPAAG